LVTEPFPHQGYTAPFGKDLPVTIPALILLGLAAVVPADAPRLMPAVVEVREVESERRGAAATDPGAPGTAAAKAEASAPKLAPARRVKSRPGRRTQR